MKLQHSSGQWSFFPLSVCSVIKTVIIFLKFDILGMRPGPVECQNDV